ncbi:MAG: pilus assembly protein PilN [Candidatus Methylumidiphilus alinenensis]|uniref:Pilus assembly protein PilN n=1 Tax=Candidatus Methylumidiphilus alinenensis TaxID=2202197 RepID=A0A2W4SPV5_9GAMM|nr:MAG: pilus assembly protein PilN [Candidatus Methylumidiphilus alinenensis]
MAHLNLLPWRAELRRQQQKDFITVTAFGVLITLLLLLLLHLDINSRIDYQSERNKYIQSEIASLDSKIKEIQDLEIKRKRLLAKMEVIQELQASRPEIVHLFDELGRTIPEGLYLTDLSQSDKNLIVNGMAQSNARISAYMRNLESSAWLKDPVLNIIETKVESKDNRKERQSRFTLQIKQATEKTEDKRKGAS